MEVLRWCKFGGGGYVWEHCMTLRRGVLQFGMREDILSESSYPSSGWGKTYFISSINKCFFESCESVQLLYSYMHYKQMRDGH